MLIETRKQPSLQALTRQRDAARPAFFARMSTALGKSVPADRLLPIDRSIALLERFSRDLFERGVLNPTALKRSYTRAQMDTAFLHLEKIGSSIREIAALITAIGGVAAAIEIEMHTVLPRAVDYLDMEQESIAFYANDQRQGLVFDWNPDDPERTADLIVWGDRWSKKAAGIFK